MLRKTFLKEHHFSWYQSLLAMAEETVFMDLIYQ